MQVLLFYFILWWFTKIEDKKLLIIRALVAGFLAVLFLMGAIVIFTTPQIVKDGFAFMGIFGLIPAILFGVRLSFDIKKILIIGNTIELKQPPKKEQSNREELRSTQTMLNGDYLKR